MLLFSHEIESNHSTALFAVEGKKYFLYMLDTLPAVLCYNKNVDLLRLQQEFKQYFSLYCLLTLYFITTWLRSTDLLVKHINLQSLLRSGSLHQSVKLVKISATAQCDAVKSFILICSVLEVTKNDRNWWLFNKNKGQFNFEVFFL